MAKWLNYFTWLNEAKVASWWLIGIVPLFSFGSYFRISVASWPKLFLFRVAKWLHYFVAKLS
jgi:hypothetical protein